MIKFLLIIWLGAGSTQTLSITKFDDQPSCNAALSAVYEEVGRLHSIGSVMKCVPYPASE
jgi:hypothetical protein